MGPALAIDVRGTGGNQDVNIEKRGDSVHSRISIFLFEGTIGVLAFDRRVAK
jgi:hypothetical protein